VSEVDKLIGINDDDQNLDYCYVLDFQIQHTGIVSKEIKACLVQLAKDEQSIHGTTDEGVDDDWCCTLGASEEVKPKDSNNIISREVSLAVLFTATVYGNPMLLNNTQRTSQRARSDVELNWVDYEDEDDSPYMDIVAKNALSLGDKKYIFYSLDSPLETIASNYTIEKFERKFRTRLESKRTLVDKTHGYILNAIGEPCYDYIQINWEHHITGKDGKVTKNTIENTSIDKKQFKVNSCF